MFDWLFEKELDCMILIRVDGYFDWIDKSVDIFRIINRHDTLKNRKLYYVYGLARSGLAEKYMPDWNYDEGKDKQWVKIKCWPEALKELQKLNWVEQANELIEVL